VKKLTYEELEAQLQEERRWRRKLEHLLGEMSAVNQELIKEKKKAWRDEHLQGTVE